MRSMHGTFSPEAPTPFNKVLADHIPQHHFLSLSSYLLISLITINRSVSALQASQLPGLQSAPRQVIHHPVSEEISSHFSSECQYKPTGSRKQFSSNTGTDWKIHAEESNIYVNLWVSTLPAAPPSLYQLQTWPLSLSSSHPGICRLVRNRPFSPP